MSENKINLRIKIGTFELEFEGSRQTVLEMAEQDLPRLVELVSKSLPSIASTTVEAVQSAQSPSLPENQLEDSPASVQGESCADAIVNLLSTEWGRKRPRTLGEIKESLDANALHYSGKVIGFTLTRLTRRQKVRRWKLGESFVYTLAS
ncbi:MAG: hypothetical protein ACE5KO_00755 [Candidatus Bathyarchaeia archaeon]